MSARQMWRLGRTLAVLGVLAGAIGVLVSPWAFSGLTLAATAAGWSGLALMRAAWARAPRAPRLARAGGAR